MKTLKTLISILIPILLIALLLPIIIYIAKFHDTPLSNDPASWGVLGDYFGGILNPIISIASLVLLGYLTYLVAIETNKENKNLFVLERKMSAYNELVEHVKSLNIVSAELANIIAISSLELQVHPENVHDIALRKFEKMKNIAMVYTKLYYTIFNFKLQYQHIFQYKFDSDEFNALKEESSRLHQFMSRLGTNESNDDYNPATDFERLINLLIPVLQALHNEINMYPQTK